MVSVIENKVSSQRVFTSDSPTFNPLEGWSPTFLLSKRTIDISAAITGLCLAAVAAIILMILNPIFNPGPLLYKQVRMGKQGRPFTMWKFRSMTAAKETEARLPTDPLETERITPLGQFIRRARIDELPNFASVLTGEMALVGPRPDVWDHATWFTANIPYYKHRIRVKPGITGLAQIRGGYADQLISINRKARYDYYYIHHGTIKLEAYIIAKTISVMLLGTGAK